METPERKEEAVTDERQFMHCPDESCPGELVLDEECIHIHTSWMLPDGRPFEEHEEDGEGQPTGERHLRCNECDREWVAIQVEGGRYQVGEQTYHPNPASSDH